ncbi:pathogenesis-related thaumatin family protein [Trifolium medium]|uniref:Pathogenesis-related thaumatin family protein n=1 Tax=Trifolium medium TaxID=97028 RepID=A0A392V0Y2_9FABA|nr:pathogenesis-related thaumatin family protein [Trifolium medium]
MVSGTKFLNCNTGDCGSALTCAVNGDRPLTLAEFTLNGSNNLDLFWTGPRAGPNPLLPGITS